MKLNWKEIIRILIAILTGIAGGAAGTTALI